MADASNLRLGIQHVRRNGDEIGYAIAGRGAPVLWLSPFAVPTQAIDIVSQASQLLAQIAERFTLQIIDCRGEGESATAQRHGDFLEEQIADTISAFDNASVAQAHVIANLLTVPWAIALAARHPNRVASLVLWSGMLSGRGFAEGERWKSMVARASSPDTAFAIRSWVGIVGVVGGANEARDQARLFASRPAHPANRPVVRDLLTTDVASEAERVSCPTLVVSPEDGVLPGPEMVEEVARAISHARLVRTPGAAISAHLDDLGTASSLILDWLNLHAPAPQPTSGQRLDNLTQRELQVAMHVAQGRTNGEIGVALSISPYTVRRHVSNIIAKLGVANRSELAAVIGRSLPD